MTVKFWSSVEYGGFLKALIKELNQNDIQAEQCFVISEKQYRNVSGFIGRLSIRIQQYMIYPLYIFLKVLTSRRTDIHVICTNTFYAPLLVTFAHRRIVHLVYDLYPEALIHSGKLKSPAFLVRIIQSMTQATFNRSEYNVYLGKKLKAYILTVYNSRNNSEIIPVGADASQFKNLKLERLSRPSVLYCGNFGYLHELETVVSTWNRMGDPTEFIDWRFYCSGTRFPELKKALASFKKTKFPLIQGLGLPNASWVQTMVSSSIGLITMISGSEKVLMPSKTYSAMVAGQAILAIAPESSDLVDLIKEHDCGWWVEPGDVDGLVRLLEEIAGDPEQVLEKRKNAYQAGHENYSQEVLVHKWIELFESVMAKDE